MKLAFVLPWYGKGIPGGAESEARSTVQQLVKAGYSVEVFTTCIKDFFADWATNSHRAGTVQEEGITVHRYPVLPRDKAGFDMINQKIIGRTLLTPEETVGFADEFINCPELLAALYQNRDRYLFFFIPYLFPTTFNGLPLVGRNSVLIPCLHDEGYVYQSLFSQIIPMARAIIWQTQSEYRLARNLYSLPANQIQAVLGGGVDISHHDSASPAAFKEKYSIHTRYMLYAGRKDAGKNLGQLFSYWRLYQQESGRHSQLKLILIGPGSAQIPHDLTNTVFDLGFVSAEDKRNAFAGATVFCQPSIKESFSLVLMDAWLAEKPVLVNGLSDVLVEHVRQANGGLYYGNHEEFIAMIDWILDHEEEAAAMGKNGRAYVETSYSWDIVIDGYIQLIDQIAEKNQLQIERHTAD
ncbi:MAG: glycosyltransferase involved in cell wall biosynthesis [Cellvibrionaceae bacterium]|jgi:glycosyltransferase involved in cell wall biosynthesis